MTDEPRAITAADSKSKPQTTGAKRATLAFVFSVLALVVSSYNFWSNFKEQDGRVVSPLMLEKTSGTEIAALETRVKEQETALSELNEALKKQGEALTQKMNAPPVEVKPETANLDAINGATAPLQQKLAELEKQNADTLQNVNQALQQKSKLLKGLAVLQLLSHKMQQGLIFQNELAEAEDVFSSSQDMMRSYNLLRSFDHSLPADSKLVEELHLLVPDFLAKEKMEHADGFFNKVLIQLQKLVIIRRKNGQVDEETPAAKILEQLESSILSGDWKKATEISASLVEKAPKDFPAWEQKLRDRANAEDAVAKLQHQILTVLGGDNSQNAKPAELAPAPSPAPATGAQP